MPSSAVSVQPPAANDEPDTIPVPGDVVKAELEGATQTQLDAESLGKLKTKVEAETNALVEKARRDVK